MTSEGFNFDIVTQYFKNTNIISLIDIFIVALLIWVLLSFLSKTRGIQIAKGLIFLYILCTLAHGFKLTLLTEFFETLYRLLFYSLPVIFQREIRTALENFGRIKFLKSVPSEKINSIKEISNAVNGFSKNKVGALMIIEQTTPLQEYTNSASQIDATISKDLLDCIFRNQSALHDGAVIIRENRIVSAKCILPLSEATNTGHNFGTRHRSAIGITEISDSIAIVVSEETGTVSISYNGTLTKLKNASELEPELIKLFNLPQRKKIVLFK